MTGAAGNTRLAGAFRREELAGLRLATIGRAISIGAIGLLLAFLVPAPGVYFIAVMLAVFVGLGFAHYLVSLRIDSPVVGYVFITLDMILMTVATLAVFPLYEPDWPAQMALRHGGIVYFFLLLAAVAFSYSPRLMLWAGFVGAACWGAALAWFATRPGAVRSSDYAFSDPAEVRLAFHLDPAFVDIGVRVQDAVLLFIVACVLAGVVVRSRRLVARQAVAERERTNLARHFPPNIVDELSQLDEPLGDVRTQPVAVLFADMVGFTRLAETDSPDRVVATLRELHSRLEAAVFENGGTLDKFLGDGVMATFGTPRTGPHDAANALRCGQAMLGAVDDWNRTRAAAGETPVRLSIGLHYGEVILGDVGSERRLEFAALGDTVNVASRLEEATRELHCRLAASNAIVQAARGQGDDAFVAQLVEAGPQGLRGRTETVHVWMLPAAPAAGEGS